MGGKGDDRKPFSFGFITCKYCCSLSANCEELFQSFQHQALIECCFYSYVVLCCLFPFLLAVLWGCPFVHPLFFKAKIQQFFLKQKLFNFQQKRGINLQTHKIAMNKSHFLDQNDFNLRSLSKHPIF